MIKVTFLIFLKGWTNTFDTCVEMKIHARQALHLFDKMLHFKIQIQDFLMNLQLIMIMNSVSANPAPEDS